MDGKREKREMIKPSKTISVKVMEQLEKDILSGFYKPGVWMIESEIANSLGVSRGPVREAFLLLERRGLIKEKDGNLTGDDTREGLTAIISIKGNPSLGYIKGFTIGLRNRSTRIVCAEVWVNELRMSGLEEDGGVAGIARLELQLADLPYYTRFRKYRSRHIFLF